MKLIKSAAARYILFALIVIGFFSATQFLPSKGFSDPDGYYHAGAAKLISQGKLEATFPWAYFSTLRQDYGDQHYLYHLLLIPLSSPVGMHLSVVIFSSLMVFAFVWLLKQFGVKFATIWGLFLIGSSVDFLFRISVVKANTLSLVLLFLTVWLLLKKKYIWLVPLSALFVWVYGGFVFLPVVVGMYFISYAVVNFEFRFRPVFYVLLGIAIGLMVHPHFPDLVIHLYYQLFQSGLGAGLKVPVGGEWNPYSLPELVSANGLALLSFVMTSAVFVVEFFELRQDKPEKAVGVLFLWLTTIFFLILTVRSRRFVEYSVPFFVFFSAYVVSNVVNAELFKHVKQAWSYWHMKFFTVIIAWVIILVLGLNVSRVEQWLKNSARVDGLKGSSLWLSGNTQPGEIVFNTKWDDLPQLFYWNSNNYYIIGLDPTFLYAYNHELYWKWRQIADNDPSKFNNSYAELKKLMGQDFQSKYIVLENSRDDQLKEFLDNNEGSKASRVYTDDFSSVYKID